MVILDLHQWEGSLLTDIELQDDETGVKIPAADVLNLVELVRPKAPGDPRRYQVVKDDSIYVLFPLDKPGEVHSRPEVRPWLGNFNLAGGEVLTLQELQTALQQKNSGPYWGSIFEVVDGAMPGRMALVSCLPDGSYDAVIWNSLDGRFNIHWDGQRVSLVAKASPAIPAHGGIHE